ncbi:MAG: PEP/pyruvate-binding domain-containing protein [Bacteroidota bacterium]
MKNKYQKLLEENKERIKELTCINQTTQIIREGKSIPVTLQQIVRILPDAWQYPSDTRARIYYEDEKYTSPGFQESNWRQSQSFITLTERRGAIEIYYLSRHPEEDEGPFLYEERHLLNNLCSMITNFINSFEAQIVLKKTLKNENYEQEILEIKEGTYNSRQLLQTLLNKYNSNRDIFHDLQPFNVKEILLVATLYDAYCIEREGRFTEHILGEYHQLNLTSMPRITGVTSYQEAISKLQHTHFDMVILIVGTDKQAPLRGSEKIKKLFPYMPIYLLLNNNLDLEFFSNPLKLKHIDRMFIWNGDAKVFFAMVKHLEDRVNIKNDTDIGMVKIILLVEDSVKYYSKYLPLLYNSVMEQTRRIMEDVKTDEMYKVLRYRARPKVILATTYEEAIDFFTEYQDHLLCLITDVKFTRNGKLTENAGFELVKTIRKQYEDLPTIIQSSDPANAHQAHKLKSIFINKNSDTLIQDVKSFINHYLGFGNFIYRDSKGHVIAEARNLLEFEKYIDIVPEESLTYHGRRNHFSLWLMARGEIKIARMINPIKISDFNSPQEFRSYLRLIIQKYRNEASTGRIVNYNSKAVHDETSIVSLGPGALGGKGRGLAFINTLVHNINFKEIIPGITVKTPRTSIIGTDEFDVFMEKNKLYEIVMTEQNFNTICTHFVNAKLSYDLAKKLREFIKEVKQPLAVRSSSLFEDSTMQPFSGIFDTYLIPNNHPDDKIRLNQLKDAIKLVYASVFSPSARLYFEAVNHKIEEEKMAVIIQEVVGNQYGKHHYPTISGNCQSHNFYPIAHMEPSDGFAVVGLGLGKYIVEGEKAYRFSPKFPTLEITSPKDQIINTQTEFYALNMDNNNIDLTIDGDSTCLDRLSIYEAEKHGTLKHLASVYNENNDTIQPGLDKAGPRILNFANIIKYEYIPMAKTIEVMLNVFHEALGAPVELEFAVNLNEKPNSLPSFYLLQMKPLLENAEDYTIEKEKDEYPNWLLYTQRSLGNGLIENLADIIIIEPGRFDKMATEIMAEEVGAFNKKLKQEGKKYILIGPGRWGTRDKYIGVPVSWPQISHAKIIVELGLQGFPLDASLGSHFFHNVTSMNVGYFSITESEVDECLNWKVINQQKIMEEKKYFKHIRFDKPLTVMMDGRKRISLVLHNE